ncbi:MAG: glycosyltransferase [Candidatus Omnitrophica bacterium]|nr:glycosyltransferase [Candidatus Omnitrophota bacterium]
MRYFCVFFCKRKFRGVYIEAAARNKPIITTDNLGAKELILNGYNGYRVPLRDYKMMAKKIIFLSNNYQLIREMGANNSSYIKKLGYFASPIEKMLRVKRMWEETVVSLDKK